MLLLAKSNFLAFLSCAFGQTLSSFEVLFPYRGAPDRSKIGAGLTSGLHVTHLLRYILERTASIGLMAL